MISKIFILLLALIIILGLHCSYSTPLNYNQPSVEKFSTLDQPHIDDVNNNIGGYDPETDKIQNYCYYDNIPKCNHTKLPIHGCAVENGANVDAIKLQNNAVYEFFESSPDHSTESQQQGGASSTYNRHYQPVESIDSCPKPKPPRPSPKPPICPEPCVPRQYEECRDCDITTNKDINKYVLKTSVPPCPDMSKYAKKSNLCPCVDMSKYILKSEVPGCHKPNLNDYIKKSEIPACPKCPTCPECPECTYKSIKHHPDYKNHISRKECEKQCEKHIKDKITKFDENDPKFKKALKKYLKKNNYIKESDCPTNGWNNGGDGGGGGNGWNNGGGGGTGDNVVNQGGYTSNGNYNDLYQNC